MPTSCHETVDLFAIKQIINAKRDYFEILAHESYIP